VSYKFDIFCPFRNHEIPKDNTPDDLLVHCHTECGLYNKEDRQCSIVTIAQELGSIRNHLSNIETTLEEQNQ